MESIDPLRPQQLKAPDLWGSHSSTGPSFCPGHRTRSPHGLGCSKRSLKSDAGHPIRPLETRPSLTPTLDHLNALKVHFVLKDGTSIFPVSLRECLSAVPVLNPPSFHLSAPEGLTLSQASFLLLLPCP